MKKIIIGIAGLAFLASCKKISSDDVSTTLEDGTWVITQFEEDGINESSKFSGYSFDFMDNGTVTASKDTISVNGTWSIGEESDDDNPKHLELNLSFPVIDPLDELIDDWHIDERTDTKIELKDDNDSGDDDRLTFTKS